MPELPSTENLHDYADVLGSFEYWIRVLNEDNASDDGLYSITSSGISGPEDDLPDPSPIADDPVVEVVVMYSAVCYIAGTEDESEIAYEDHLGGLVSSEIEIIGEPPLDNPPETPDFAATVYRPWTTGTNLTAHPGLASGQNISVGYSGDPNIDIGWGTFNSGSTWMRRYVTSMTNTTTMVTYQLYEGQFGTLQLVDRQFAHTTVAIGPDFDFTWILYSTDRDGTYSKVVRRISHPNLGNSPAAYAAAKTVTMVKTVPRWKDRELPTLTYNGDEAFVDVNYETGELVSNDFWKVNTIEVENQEFTEPFGILDDIPPTNHVRIKYTRQRIYMDDLILTIGPSTYVPPEPL
jgi:hypothetical protein